MPDTPDTTPALILLDLKSSCLQAISPSPATFWQSLPGLTEGSKDILSLRGARGASSKAFPWADDYERSSGKLVSSAITHLP